MANLLALAMLLLFGGAMTFGVWVLRAAVRIRKDEARAAQGVQTSLDFSEKPLRVNHG